MYQLSISYLFYMCVCAHTCMHTVCSVVSDSFETQWIVAHLLWEFSGQNIGMGCHLLLEGIILIQGSNLSLLFLLN